MRSGLAALALLAGLLAAWPAAAHKLKVFAAAEGSVVTGHVYYFGGGRAVGVEVIVTAPSGKVAARLRTDAEGAFRFALTHPGEHRISVQSGDGHAAGTTVAAIAAAAPATAPPAAAMPAEESSQAAVPPDAAAVIEAAVARQVRPLREQIDAWQERVFWRDVLGGIGFIVGLAGLAYGLTARRERKE